MFSFPVTVPFRDPEGVFPVDLSICVDNVLKVTPLDKDHSFGVESDTLYSCLPSCEILFEDGRKLPVMETAATINRYLDLYRQIESFYTAPATPARSSAQGIRSQHLRTERPDAVRVHPLTGATEGVVVPLFGRTSPCASSEASTPD
jgi:hypothetical protein